MPDPSVGQFVPSRCDCGGYFSGNHKDDCASIVVSEPDECPRWLTLDPELYRGGGVMSRRPPPRPVGASDKPTADTPSRGRA